jgi:hypothetical protein
VGSVLAGLNIPAECPEPYSRRQVLDYVVRIALAASYQKERFSSDRKDNGILGRLIAFRGLPTLSSDSIAGQEDIPAKSHGGANMGRRRDAAALGGIDEADEPVGDTGQSSRQKHGISRQHTRRTDLQPMGRTGHMQNPLWLGR